VTFNPLHRQPIVEHISAHILHDPSVNRSSKPCGLCLQLVPLCKIVLKKGKGQAGNLAIDMKASTCPNLVRFSIAVATVCSNSSPCTNHPFICPHCDDSEPHSVVWSYNFRFHLLHRHPRVSTEDYNNIIVLTKLEKEKMKRTWTRHLVQQNVHQKSQCAPLVISEMYRSCLVLKCIFTFYFNLNNNSTYTQTPK